MPTHDLGPSEEGSVVLDIGGDVGAAIVHAPAVLVGSEIEIRSLGAAWDGTHVAVRIRQIPGGETSAALFPGLRLGFYEVRLRGDDSWGVAAVVVEGGRVTEARLGSPEIPAAPLPAAPGDDHERPSRDWPRVPLESAPRGRLSR